MQHMPLLTDSFPLPVLADRGDAGCACGAARPRAWRSWESRREVPARSAEFPDGADLPPEGIARRGFLQVAMASLAAAGFTGCFRQPAEDILPYSHPPEGLTPGVPLHFATGLEWDGLVVGLVVESHEGRPTKVEGNPSHPASLGAAGVFEQAALLGLYDASRARTCRLEGQEVAWSTVQEALEARARRADEGAGLRFLVEPTGSPLLLSLQARILERFPRARFVPFRASLPEGLHEGTRRAYGRPLDVVHDVAREVVVSLGADFLATTRPGNLVLARDFLAARKPESPNRLWVAESALSVTGGFADERLRAKPSQLRPLALALAAEVGAALQREEWSRLRPPVEALSDAQRGWVRRAARDLLAHRGRGRVLVGPESSGAVQALAFAIDEALGNAPRLIEPVARPLGGLEALASLVGELRAGTVDTLIITAWNPVYAAPVDLGLAEALSRAPFRLYHALHEDETSAHCPSFVPAAHAFESWRDGRAPDGTAAVLQPLIAPLFPAAMQEADVLGVFAGLASQSPHALLRALWREWAGAPQDFERRWSTWLAEGVIPGTRAAPVHAELEEHAVLAATREPVPPASGLELSLVLDAKVHDGRFAGNAWLQELPEPMAKLTWGNAAWLSPATAARLGLEKDDVVRLALRGQSLDVPVLVMPGQADDTVTLALGYGREAPEGVAQGVGVNAFRLRHLDAPWGASGVGLTAVGRREALALTQEHWSMEGRELALQVPRARLTEELRALRPLQEDAPHLYAAPLRTGAHQWGMAMDLHRCTGCGACVVACQVENNVPVVGKEGVLRSREMHWLRIDRYFLGDPDDPGVITQPVACVHCAFAPCEYVCPVNATVHSDEGLNQMVYNRCIGTRYCSNNCPYKVRRFNYLEYQQREPLARLRQNPSVTVRSRGVMEKCTYCVQRIERARANARARQRDLRDGEVRTACQQTCPTRAIVFGDLNAPDSEVKRRHEDPRHYRLLNEQGTQPRTVHLLRVKNPAPRGGT
ncbi:4Fe-4S dicluster domain-containing protein [Corallococcus sp. M34]|nr:4Fe-4S dicluster domain-containing protein [Citreicoccus inhibens]